MIKPALLLMLVGIAFVASMPTDSFFKQRAHDCMLNNNCISRDWTIGERAEGNTHVKLVFALRQKNLDKLEKILYDVSDPKSENYGKHLTFAQVKALTKDAEAIKGVLAFLRRHEVKNYRVIKSAAYIIAHVTVAKAEQMLSAEYYNFYSDSLGTSVVRTLEYKLPASIYDLVEFVGYTVQFPATTRALPIISASAKGRADYNYDGNVTPDLLQTYYKIKTTTVQNSGATQSLFESLGQSFSPKDLTTFQQNFNLPTQAISKVIGPNTPASCQSDPNNCVEANLDVQYIMGVAQGSPTTYWSIPNSNQDIFLEWILAVEDTTNPPLVHSMSYGSIEQEEVKKDMQSFNTAAMKLGTQGITIFVASGDDGVANFGARGDKANCGFHPSYPATSPYVTAVGATQGPEYGETEVACSSKTGGLITSGGGFSTEFSQPSYQSTAVSNYLSSGVKLPPSSMYQGSGRAYPDLALVGHNYEVCIAGQFYQVAGTSCSTPSTAGIFTLINDARITAGQSPLGFLNVAIYSLASNSSSPFKDITSGENNCCAGDQGQETCCTYGFYATNGWDPVTGWGSVDATALLNAFTN